MEELIYRYLNLPLRRASPICLVLITGHALATDYTVTNLGILGGTGSSTIGINDNGQVVGVSETAGDAAQNAFLWSNGTMTNLGTFGGLYSSAYAINNDGQVVGSAATADNTASDAFLWSNGTMVDLNSFVSLAGGDYLIPAMGINDSGQIIADSVDGHAYLLTPTTAPVPEPADIWLMLSGLGVIGSIFRKHNAG